MSILPSKTAKEEKVIAALLECRTLAEVSERCSIPPRSLHTLLKKPEFREKLNTAKSTMLCQAVVKLNAYTAGAVHALNEIAEDCEQSGAVRVSAYKAILDQTKGYNEQLDILARLDELERIQADNSRN